MNKNKIIEEIKIRYGQTQAQAERTYREAISQINKNKFIENSQTVLYKSLFSPSYENNLGTDTLRSGRVRFKFDFSRFPNLNEQKEQIARRVERLADTDDKIFEQVVNFLDDKISYRELKRYIKRRKQSPEFIRRHAPGSY